MMATTHPLSGPVVAGTGDAGEPAAAGGSAVMRASSPPVVAV
jgi:hypothetical protein